MWVGDITEFARLLQLTQVTYLPQPGQRAEDLSFSIKKINTVKSYKQLQLYGAASCVHI